MAGDETGRLFAPSELELRPTGLARLRAVALRTVRLGAREKRRQEDAQVLHRLQSLGSVLAERFGLRYACIEAEREGVHGHYGICYSDGRICIRLRHATTGRLLKESSLVDTLCHELAHLRHMNHGLRFRRLYGRILDQARGLGYYRPGPVQPRQRSLFEDGSCGTGK